MTLSKVSARGSTRRVSLSEEVPSDRFILIVGLMVLFFVGLVGLERARMTSSVACWTGLLRGSWRIVCRNMPDGLELV